MILSIIILFIAGWHTVATAADADNKQFLDRKKVVEFIRDGLEPIIRFGDQENTVDANPQKRIIELLTDREQISIFGNKLLVEEGRRLFADLDAIGSFLVQKNIKQCTIYTSKNIVLAHMHENDNRYENNNVFLVPSGQLHNGQMPFFRCPPVRATD